MTFSILGAANAMSLPDRTPTTQFHSARFAMRLLLLLITSLITFNVSADSANPEHPPPVAAALAVLDDFMAAFNDEDIVGWSDTLHYPHVRFASETVTVYTSAAEFTDRPVFEGLRSAGWRRSAWRSRAPTLVSDSKVHLETVFERYNAAGEPIGRYHSLYIVTKINGHWGIQARSSLAP